MILIEHGNMWFIGSGYYYEAEHWARSIIECTCIGAVNGFVLISGWFGIRTDLRKIGDLMFMILFCTLPILIFAILYHWIPVSNIASLDGIYEYILGGNGYWFVADYIGLLIIAPILNKGIENLNRSQFSNVLIAGYSLIGIYDFVLRQSVLGVEGGYSVIWMGYLYLLARYMRLYGLSWIDRHCYALFFSAVILQSILFYFGLIGLRYTNPLILLPAMCLICIFSHREFKNRFVNLAAKGALLAYLLHMQPILVPYFRKFLFSEYKHNGYWIYMLEVIGLSIGVYLIAILLNWVQAKIYKAITNATFNRNTNV